MSRAVLIEGYAAVFGQADQIGDCVRAGAFSRSLRGGVSIPMLLQHKPAARVGRWTRLIEDGRGLFVRGLVESAGAITLIDRGLDGLSIGFRPRLARPRVGEGRDLIDLELVEISLVAHPMQTAARFGVPAKRSRAA